jgi:hypothetical protein
LSYTSNAGNGGAITDNLFWECGESEINAYGTQVGPANMDYFEQHFLEQATGCGI